MSLRRILLLIGLLGVAILLVTSFGQFGKFTAALRGMHWYLIPLLVLVQLVSYWGNAGFYRAFFRITGHKVSFRKLYEASLAVNFATQAIPAGAAAGVTYLTQALADDVPAGQATLSQLARYVFTFLSFFPILAVGFILLFFGGNIGKFSVRFILLFMLALLVVAIVLILVFAERKRLQAFLNPFIAASNWFGRTILRRPVTRPLVSRNQFADFLDEFYKGYREITQHRKYRLKLEWWAFVGNASEVLSVWVVFIGFGHLVSLGTVIAGYTFAIIASVAGVVTNGVGVYEAGMIGTFTALGEPFGLSFAVVIVYRGLSMLLFLPPGFYYYRQHLKSTGKNS